MIYLIGGAPRSGKTILAQQFAAQRKSGWISTDLLFQVLRAKKVPGTKVEWDATPQVIAAHAKWFFPSLERFVFGVSGMAESYVIEGVLILPTQVAQLTARYQVRSVFIGCSKMTLARFDRYPGRSKGYADLPRELRRQFAGDIPRWSEFVRQEAERIGYPYVDMSDDFPARLREASALLGAQPAARGSDTSAED